MIGQRDEGTATVCKGRVMISCYVGWGGSPFYSQSHENSCEMHLITHQNFTPLPVR